MNVVGYRSSTQLLQRQEVPNRLRHRGHRILLFRGTADEAYNDVLALQALPASPQQRQTCEKQTEEVTNIVRVLAPGSACIECTVPTNMDAALEPMSLFRSNLRKGQETMADSPRHSNSESPVNKPSGAKSSFPVVMKNAKFAQNKPSHPAWHESHVAGLCME